MGELFVYSAFLGIFFFLLPIFVRVDAYVDARENKLWFSLSLYRFFRVFGGYAELRREGLVLHLTEKKAVIVPFAQMGSTRKKFEITKGFQLYSFHQIVETGGASSPYGALIGAFFQSAAGQATLSKVYWELDPEGGEHLIFLWYLVEEKRFETDIINLQDYNHYRSSTPEGELVSHISGRYKIINE